MVSYPTVTLMRGKVQLIMQILVQRHIHCIQPSLLVLCDAYGPTPTKKKCTTDTCECRSIVVWSDGDLDFEIYICRTKKCVNSYQSPFPRDVLVGSGHKTIEAVHYVYTTLHTKSICYPTSHARCVKVWMGSQQTVLEPSYPLIMGTNLSWWWLATKLQWNVL